MNANTLSKKRRRRLFDIVERMGKYHMKWDILNNNVFSEPKSDRELLMVIANEIRHITDVIDELRENQDDIRKTMAAPSPQFNELKARIDNISEKLEELKKIVEDNEKALQDLCLAQERYNTYFKILGAFVVLFPTLLLTIFQIIWG